ncbi:MAG: FAD-binding protein [Ardenticatenaceae bacterium]|nr:FAD-binding protein [Ardenticatenaceae bacterium]
MLQENQTNWAGNLVYSAREWLTPTTVEELQTAVNQSHHLRPLGSRHSFNTIADSPDTIVPLGQLNRVLALDRERGTVTAEGGIRYGELGQYLHAEGFALPNLASLPHISVVGACATATHGSGDGNGGLATAVSALQLLTANGDLLTLSRDDDRFYAAVVGLGALGIITQITLDVQPTFDVAQVVYLNLPFAQVAAHFDAIFSAAYSVSLFTDWQNGQFGEVWLKHRLTGEPFAAPDTFFGAAAAPGKVHPILGLPTEPCTEQLGIPGPWHERLPHFRLDFTPSSGAELQSEYFVPRRHAPAALAAIFALQEKITPHLLISEIRTIAADNFWLSPCYQQPMVALHFTWQRNWPAVAQVLPHIEAALEPFNGRPHWGKLFTMPAAQIHPHYPRLADFQQLRRQLDPTGKFSNPFLETVLG